MSEERSSITWIAVVIVLVGLAAIAGVTVVTYLDPFGTDDAGDAELEWNVTVIGRGGEERVLSFAEITALPLEEGYGGSFSSVGVVSGPFILKGVPLTAICALVGGLEPGNTVWVSAPDGYLIVFTYDQVHGEFRAFDPETFKEVGQEEFTVILAFEQDGAPLSEYYGKPLRLSIVSDREDIITMGSYWVKWVDRIEVRAPAGVT